jgi:hypothetical protein
MGIPGWPLPAVWTIVLVAFVAVLLLWLGKTSALLKDQLIPQIPAAQQTFSLARSQMAWWFIIILGGFLYVFLVQALGPHPDFTAILANIITPQAVALMGISAVTAGGGAWVDAAQDTPEDSLNDGLKLLGLCNIQDVAALRQDIASLTAQLQAMPQNPVPLPPDMVAKLQDTLRDKQLLLQNYQDRTAPFCSQGWFRDMTSDVDGTALHRLQALVWTILLGVIFVFLIAKTSRIPQLDDNLLALMGISSAGYVGFKYNETQY